MKAAIIFCALVSFYFAGLIALGLWTGNMPSGRGSMSRKDHPAGFWVSGVLWGVCALIFLLMLLALLFAND